MPVSHKALQPIDIIESPIQLNQCQITKVDGQAILMLLRFEIGQRWPEAVMHRVHP